MEFHKQTAMDLNDVWSKMKEMGYNCNMELLHDGVCVTIVGANGMPTKFVMDLYENLDGMKTYEIKTKTKEDFTKLYEIFMKL
jgi:hypothetical protein